MPLLRGVTLSRRKPPLASSARHSPTVRSLPPASAIIWEHGTRGAPRMSGDSRCSGSEGPRSAPARSKHRAHYHGWHQAVLAEPS